MYLLQCGACFHYLPSAYSHSSCALVIWYICVGEALSFAPPLCDHCYSLSESLSRSTGLREHLISSHFFPKRNAFRNGGRGVTPFSNRKMTVRTFPGCVHIVHACARSLRQMSVCLGVDLCACVWRSALHCMHAGYSEVSSVTSASSNCVPGQLLQYTVVCNVVEELCLCTCHSLFLYSVDADCSTAL